MQTKEQIEFHTSNFLIRKHIFLGGPSGCPVQCVFCLYRFKNPANDISKNLYRTPFLTLDDLKKYYIPIMDLKKYDIKTIALEGWYTDPFANPNIYDIIYYLTDRYPHIEFSTVTSGTHIDNDHLPHIYKLKNFQIMLSIHTFQDKYRQLLFKEARTAKILNIFNNIENILPLLSNMGDMKNIIMDLNIIKDRGIKKLLFRRIDHTKYANDEAKDISNKSIKTYGSAISYILDQKPDDMNLIAWVTDLEYCRKYGIYEDELDRQIKHITNFFNSLPAGKYLFCCPESSYSFFKKEFEIYNNIEVILIKNNLFGGSIVIGGLLTFQDIITEVQKYDTSLYSGFIVTNDMLSFYDHISDLLNMTLYQASETLQLKGYTTGITKNFVDYQE